MLVWATMKYFNSYWVNIIWLYKDIRFQESKFGGMKKFSDQDTMGIRFRIGAVTLEQSNVRVCNAVHCNVAQEVKNLTCTRTIWISLAHTLRMLLVKWDKCHKDLNIFLKQTANFDSKGRDKVFLNTLRFGVKKKNSITLSFMSQWPI